MSWWTSWGGVYQGGALQNPDTGAQKPGPQTGTSDARVTVTDERAMGISVVFACTRILVQGGSTLPLKFYRGQQDSRELLEPNHYLWDLLKYKPNNFMTAKQFRQAIWTQRVLWGNGYAKIKWMGDRPVSLVPLKPEFMSVYRTTTGLEYHYRTENGVKKYSQRDIFHLKNFSADGIMGISVLSYARNVLGLSLSADRRAANSVNGNPSAILEMEQFPTPVQTKQLREQYGDNNITNEYKSDGGLVIIPGGMKWKGVSIPPDVLQLLESRQFQVPEFCRFMGVPSVLVDGAVGATAAWPASYEQQMQQFLAFGLRPYFDEWEDVIPYSLTTGPDKRDITAEHSVEGLLRADSAGRAAFYNSALQNGWMTTNEVRRKENLPPAPGGDEIRVPMNMGPAGDTNAEQT